ncbi:hypothetical protein D3C85_1731200 [compost metagenome]
MQLPIASIHRTGRFFQIINPSDQRVRDGRLFTRFDCSDQSLLCLQIARVIRAAPELHITNRNDPIISQHKTVIERS